MIKTRQVLQYLTVNAGLLIIGSIMYTAKMSFFPEQTIAARCRGHISYKDAVAKVSIGIQLKSHR